MRKERHAHDTLFNGDAFRDSPTAEAPIKPHSPKSGLLLNMKYSVAPINVSLREPSLFVLYYIMQWSGTTYHSFIN